MEEAHTRYLDGLIAKICRSFDDVQVLRRDETQEVQILDVEGVYCTYRIVISEILSPEGRKYAFYVLDESDAVIVGFDNSPDHKVIRMKYGDQYRQHIGERIPHRHGYRRRGVQVTSEMTLEMFIRWVEEILQDHVVGQEGCSEV